MVKRVAQKIGVARSLTSANGSFPSSSSCSSSCNALSARLTLSLRGSEEFELIAGRRIVIQPRYMEVKTSARSLQPDRTSSSATNTSSYPSFSFSAYLDSFNRVRLAASSSPSVPLNELDREMERLRGLEGEISLGRGKAASLPCEKEGVGGTEAGARPSMVSDGLAKRLDELLICSKQEIARQCRPSCPTMSAAYPHPEHLLAK